MAIRKRSRSRQSGSTQEGAGPRAAQAVPPHKRSPRRYRRDNEAVLILVLFMLLIVVLLYFS
ncbi:hypothetical protein [Paenibacillus sp. IHB B 3415]|uniref:hypothetical protein n=1 Tax=Paenibacillus sp. IHB B 3415 TaxID=867080 RepID=UPI00128D0D7F|nr:hypothetical protein [Paenibacillus sp. IHB B 3415]